jgi:hypothetical protein
MIIANVILPLRPPTPSLSKSNSSPISALPISGDLADPDESPNIYVTQPTTVDAGHLISAEPLASVRPTQQRTARRAPATC